ncbi:uncharacterized protein EV420DRAFT_557918 [Desarmillaria tabescens]|uniref:AB hydrolase-1 domain-containing protein n=1 Tax=Armillaria tabescens TaxID=1929756 RepID=A0AA39K708_ARMTA|nr:uncharacterized protein EV420DRAFT_557918 [Desarmillaria tabescens]KAK0455737.1 hypothetical protein EV420DRAFT_557918 [Desarmillaria tabescens]
MRRSRLFRFYRLRRRIISLRNLATRASKTFYTTGNRHGTWKFANEQGNHTLPQPVLAIYPTHDPVADWVKAAELLQSESFLPRLTTATVEGSHWIQMENPGPFNAALKNWLEANFGRSSRAEDEL